MTDKHPPHTARVVALKPRKCAMCDNPAVHRFRPFCSRRCASLDLGNWLGENYRVPADEPAHKAADESVNGSADRGETFPDKD